MTRLSRTTALSSGRRLNLLSVLSNPIRVEVLTNLALGEKCVADISSELELDPSTVSHALSKLLEAELVELEVIKRNHIYRLAPSVVVSDRVGSLQFEIATPSLKISFQLEREST